MSKPQLLQATTLYSADGAFCPDDNKNRFKTKVRNKATHEQSEKQGLQSFVYWSEAEGKTHGSRGT